MWLAGRSPLLPDAQHFVFGVIGGQNGGIYVGSLDHRVKPKRLLTDVSPAAYAPLPGKDSGYLLFMRDRTLIAAPFNPKRLELSGDTIPVIPSVDGFSVSAAGTLIYRTGAGDRKLTWFDRQGKPLGTAWSAGAYSELAISPDGSRVVVVRGDGNGSGGGAPTVWVHEFAREASTRLVPGGSSIKPVWSPDGLHVVFSAARGSGGMGLYEKLSNGTGDEKALLLKPNVLKFAWDWSPDGRWLLYSVVDPKTKEDLWLLPMTKEMTAEPKSEPFLVTDYTETDGAFSPDGRFIAYVSDEAGNSKYTCDPFRPRAEGSGWCLRAAATSRVGAATAKSCSISWPTEN